MFGNFEFLNGASGHSGYWRSDGEGSISTNRSVTVNNSMTGKFIPRHETATNLNSLHLELGEIASAKDVDQIRIGDDSTGGRIIYDSEFVANLPGRTWIKTYFPAQYSTSSTVGAFGNGVYVVLSGSSGCVVSRDFKNWSSATRSSPTTPISLCFANGVFIFGGILFGTPHLYSSFDGVEWEELESPDVINVVSGNGITLGIAYDGTGATVKIYSAQGYGVWTELSDIASFGITNTLNTKILFCNGVFFVYQTGTNFFLYSTDGTTWTKITPNSTNTISTICYTNEALYCLMDNLNIYSCDIFGAYSVTLVSSDLSNITSMVSTGSNLLIADTTDAPEEKTAKIYLGSINQYTSLLNWEAVTDFVDGDTLLGFTDGSAICHTNTIVNSATYSQYGTKNYTAYKDIDGTLTLGSKMYDKILLTSPDGTKFSLSVSNDGTITATAI